MHEEKLFHQALNYPPEERSAFLAGVCGSDIDLRGRVKNLLIIRESPTDFVPIVPEPSSKTTVVYDPAKKQQSQSESFEQFYDVAMIEPKQLEVVGQSIGPYKLLQQIGQGGFGTVYMAQQNLPVRRKVALKLLRPGMNSREIIARFEAERQALAMMNHSNIAKVFDGGVAESGLPYFVMELVRGIPITKYVTEKQLTVDDRLALFVDLCRAVQHAHQKGIIHRDLKPSNVLVTEQDGRAIVKVIDFGIAKALEQPLTDQSMFTGYAQLLGTPAYMSPEQVALSAVDVDTRSDVYSLGVLLYELITGTTPIDKATLSEAGFDGMRQMIREIEPPRPSARITSIGVQSDTSNGNRRFCQRNLKHIVRGELDWIVMKALDKDRNSRYESASALASDIERYLRREPVKACPPSFLYRLKKLWQRNRALVTTSVLVSLSILVGVSISVWQTIIAKQALKLADERLKEANELLRREDLALREVRKERDQVRQSAERARQVLYVGDMHLASRSWQRNDVAHVRELLSRHIPHEGEADLRGFEWNYLSSHTSIPSQVLLRSELPLHFVKFSPNGQLVAVAGADNVIRLFDATTFKPTFEYRSQQGEVNGLDFSPDSSVLASTGDDGTVLLWDLRTNSERLRFKAHEKLAFQVLFVQGGRMLATCGTDNVIRLWDAADGTPRGELKYHTSTVESIALSATGNLAAVSRDGEGSLWDVEKQQRIGSLSLAPKSVFNAITFTPTGHFIATGQENGILSFCRSADASLIMCQALPDSVQSLAFSPAAPNPSHWVAAGNRNGIVYLLPTDDIRDENGAPSASAKLQQARRWIAHDSRVYSLAYNPSATRLLTAGEDGFLKVWSLDSPQINKIAPKVLGDFALINDEEVVVCAKNLSICSLSTGKVLRELPDSSNEWRSVRYARAIETVFALDHAGQVFSWRLKDPIRTSIWKSNEDRRCVQFDVSPTGENLVLDVRNQDGSVRNLEFLHGPTTTRFPCNVVFALAHSPDGRFFASNYGKNIRVIDATTGTLAQTLVGHRTTINDVKFSPDGIHLASVSADRTVKVWNWRTSKLIWSELAHPNSSHHVAFSPDGGTVATVGADNMLRLWRWKLGAAVLELPLVDWPTRQLEFSNDGKRIVVIERDQARIYDSSPVVDETSQARAHQ